MNTIKHVMMVAFAAAIVFWSGGRADAQDTCNGRFVNPISDI